MYGVREEGSCKGRSIRGKRIGIYNDDVLLPENEFNDNCMSGLIFCSSVFE